MGPGSARARALWRIRVGRPLTRLPSPRGASKPRLLAVADLGPHPPLLPSYLASPFAFLHRSTRPFVGGVLPYQRVIVPAWHAEALAGGGKLCSPSVGRTPCLAEDERRSYQIGPPKISPMAQLGVRGQACVLRSATRCARCTGPPGAAWPHRLEQFAFFEVDDIQPAVRHVGDEQPIPLGVDGQVVEFLFGPAAQGNLPDAFQDRGMAGGGPNVGNTQRHDREEREQVPAEPLLALCPVHGPCSVEVHTAALRPVVESH
jgi:hypothetical protein